jgi:hypothetical protein
MIHTTTNAGLHDFVGQRVLSRYVKPGMRAADLGAGPGAMAARLQALGCDVVAMDRSADGFEGSLRHVSLDFDHPNFAEDLGLWLANFERCEEMLSGSPHAQRLLWIRFPRASNSS